MYFTSDSPPPLRTSARRLAALLAALVLIAVGPAIAKFNLAAAPDWARVLLLGGGLAMAYLAWMALAPCREALWSITWALAIAAAAGVLVMAVALFTPQERPLPLDIGPTRGPAVAWCLTIAVLSSVGSLLAGRLASRDRP
ncbi:MAG: hypothetical protein WD875_04125 [Pirellulales bacterium]